MAERTLGRSLGALLLALVNATLILAILCLYVGWRALGAAERVSDDLAVAAQAVVPLRTDIAALTAEIAGVRAALATADDARTGQELAAQLTRLEAQLEELIALVAPMAESGDVVVASAVEAAFAGFGAGLGEALAGLRGPARPEP